MRDVWLRAVALWERVPWEAVLAWHGWPVAAAVSVAMVGALWILWRRAASRGTMYGAADVLTALDRVLRGDRAGAFEVLDTASRDAHAPAEVFLAMGALLRSLGHPDRSVHVHRAVLLREDLDKALKTRAAVGLASDYLTLGRPELAEAMIKELPRGLRRQDALLALQRTAAIRAGDWKQALSAGGTLARRTRDGGAGVSAIYSRMAVAALEGSDERQAITNFKRALSTDRSNVHATEGLARLYLGADKRLRARRLLERAIEEVPDAAPRLLPLLRVAMRSRTRYRDYLEKLVERHVGSPWVDLELAELAYADDEMDHAHEILSDLVALYPRSIDVREAYLNLLIAVSDERTIFGEMDKFMALAGEEVRRFRCTSCGHTSATSFTSCPSCSAHGSVHYGP